MKRYVANWDLEFESSGEIDLEGQAWNALSDAVGVMTLNDVQEIKEQVNE